MLLTRLALALTWHCCVSIQLQPIGDESVQITSLRIRSDITYRFASTRISSIVNNFDSKSREAVFDVRLPKTAFISNFSMIIDGKLYSGEVKEKEAAAKQYEKAKQKGQSAGKVVKDKPRETQRFKVVVNVASRNEIHFNLTYQELLQRKLGSYEHAIYINPGQPVLDMRVDVFIEESRPITRLVVPPLRNDIIAKELGKDTVSNNLAVIDRDTPKSAHVAFYPTVKEQVSLDSPRGISAQFVVSYDLERQDTAGEILVADGYFVHFFSPPGLKPLPKNILFILDVSSSMTGDKISQLKEAMFAILDDLSEEDKFNIEIFSTGVKFLKGDNLMPSVSNHTVKVAKSYVKRLTPNGWTNINSALEKGFELLVSQLKYDSNRFSIAVFLTDGHPTAGQTDKNVILRNTKKSNEGGFSLTTLAFGDDADLELVQKLAAQNNGISRKIYADSDAALQLKDFYAEISSPILANVTIAYVEDLVKGDTVTMRSFPTFFEGTEVVVAGELVLSNVPNLNLSISANKAEGNLKITDSVHLEPSPAKPEEFIAFTEKLWAYLTIRQLLDQTLAETDKAKVGDLRAEALHLSLKYGFVTPLTSMVVTKPEEKELADDAESDIYDDSSPSRTVGRPHRGRDGGGGGGGGGGSSGDSDPHFIVRVKGVDEALCFNVKGQDGDVYQLVADENKDVFINGKVFGTTVKVHNEDKFRTYFGHIVLIHRPDRLIVTPRKIRLGKRSFKWTENSRFEERDLRVTVFARDNVTVDVGTDISIVIVKHKFKIMKIKFLGVYITNNAGFSPDVSGIMGEFQNKNVTVDSLYDVDGLQRAKLSVHRKSESVQLDVHLGTRLNLAENYVVPCWRVRREGKGLLDFKAPDDYLLKKLRSTKVLRLSHKRNAHTLR